MLEDNRSNQQQIDHNLFALGKEIETPVKKRKNASGDERFIINIENTNRSIFQLPGLPSVPQMYENITEASTGKGKEGIKNNG